MITSSFLTPLVGALPRAMNTLKANLTCANPLLKATPNLHKCFTELTRVAHDAACTGERGKGARSHKACLHILCEVWPTMKSVHVHSRAASHRSLFPLPQRVVSPRAPNPGRASLPRRSASPAARRSWATHPAAPACRAPPRTPLPSPPHSLHTQRNTAAQMPPSHKLHSLRFCADPSVDAFQKACQRFWRHVRSASRSVLPRRRTATSPPASKSYALWLATATRADHSAVRSCERSQDERGIGPP